MSLVVVGCGAPGYGVPRPLGGLGGPWAGVQALGGELFQLGARWPRIAFCAIVAES